MKELPEGWGGDVQITGVAPKVNQKHDYKVKNHTLWAKSININITSHNTIV